MVDSQLQHKLERMQEILRSLDRVVVAFSAGVDSTFVLKVAVDTLGPDNVIAVTAQSDSLARAEYEQAVELAERMGAPHEVVETHEMDDPNYAANPTNRCYYCKSELYTRLDDFIDKRGYKAVINGTNADDHSDFRPGLQAADEHAVRAPCAEAGMTKDDIRVLSEQMGLPTYDKPASPCLASRVQYGEAVTPEKLNQIEQAEAFLHSLGFRECRVRHHDNLARIELVPTDIERALDSTLRMQIDARFRELGYKYVALDLRGFRSGSMNEVIAFGQRQQPAT